MEILDRVLKIAAVWSLVSLLLGLAWGRLVARASRESPLVRPQADTAQAGAAISARAGARSSSETT